MNKWINERTDERTNVRTNEYLKNENTRRPLTPLIDSNNKQNSANIVNNNTIAKTADQKLTKWWNDEMAHHVKECFGLQAYYSK